MNIAIVDDELDVRKTLKEYAVRFGEESQMEISVWLFPSADVFLAEYKKIFDIIIFDIDMPGTNGMEAARKIRETDNNVTIIFITNFAQYAINGYEVDAVDYIIKPIGYYDFSMKFARTVAKAEQKKEHFIRITTSEGEKKLKVSAIKYVEVLSHYLHIHTIRNVYKVRGNIGDIQKELEIYNFVRIHRSYIINLKYLTKMLTKEVSLGDDILPVGRNYKDILKQEYMRYIRGEE